MDVVEIKPMSPADQVSEDTIRRVNFAVGNLSNELYGTTIRFVRGRNSYVVKIDSEGRVRVRRIEEAEESQST